MAAQHALEPEKAAPAPGEAQPRLSVRGVSLTLSRRIVLDEVSFTVAPGEIFGLLGPNGSGKTSLLRCLTGVLRPDLGVFWLEGKELSARTRALRAQIGVVFQEPSLDDRLTARENLLLSARLFGVVGREAETRVKELLVFMELADRQDDRVKTFSGGMKRRLEIARALIHRPTLLIMDEPSAGLDVHAFGRLWQRLQALRRLQGLSILCSTHGADEAAQCDRLLVMDRGHVVTIDTPEGLLSRLAGDVLVLEADEPEALAHELSERLQLRVRATEGVVVLQEERGHELIPRLVESFPKGRIKSISLRRPTLADAFLEITGRRLTDDASGGRP